MQSWNLHFGNKGIIFTLDAIAALFIVLTMLLVSAVYMYRTNQELPNMETLRTGYDIITILDYNKTLETLDQNYIQSQMNFLLPSKYDMLINITSTDQNLTIGNNPPTDRFVASGKRFSVIANPNTATLVNVKFFIWLK